MARTLKGTRARGLPPKVLLSQQQNATGSFPTTWRTSSDNRTGRYPVFFNDNKVLVYNQPVTDVGVSAATYSQYEEKFINVGSSGNPVTGSIITFDYAFSGTPVVALTELTPSTNTPTVNAFVKTLTSTGMTVEYSAPFEGTIVYRAIYQPVQGVPVNVLRSPRFADQYSLVVAKYGSLTNSHIDINFSDFGSIPTENYIVFRDLTANNRQNISGSITYISNTSIAVTGSASGLGSTIMHYMGFGASTLTNNDISVKGIVYPLLMDTQTMADGLSVKAMGDLFKQPYFSGSEIVNQPIVASGSLQKGISDIFVTFTPGQDIQPFQDFSNPEVDGKISASIGGVNPFYATGSAVEVTGLGFQQPLWSKNKIEIDITPVTEQTFYMLQTGSAGNYIMGYWNPNTKRYEGIGTGKGRSSYPDTVNGLRQFLDEQTIGFATSMNNGGTPTNLAPNQYNIMGRQTSNFGFPYHPKFQPTSSQQISLHEYISEPFLLEKIVLEFSGSVYNEPVGDATWTFFLLNSKYYVSGSISPPQTIQYKIVGPGNPLTITTQSLISNTVCDIIDHLQMCRSSSLDTLGFLNRELLLPESTNPIKQQFVLQSTVKTSVAYSEGLAASFSGSSIGVGGAQYIESLNYAGRNQLNNPSGRDWRSVIENPATIGTASYFIGGFQNVIDINAAYTKKNPYILLPTDKITFGYQLPWWTFAGGGYDFTGYNSITFSPQGINKIILYGSTLRLNPETNQLEEYHDTLNQLLSSNSIHEIIGE